MNELLDYAGADGLIISKPKEKFRLRIECTEIYCKACIYLCKKQNYEKKI